MVKIGLDKTLNESFKIVNGEVESPKNVSFKEFCYAKTHFNFKNIEGFCAPIEHVGLAKIVYESALSSFYTTKLNEDGSVVKIFEELPKGSHIADCLVNFSPEVLNWYKDKQNGEPLSILKYPELSYIKPDLTKYEKYCDLNVSNENMVRVNVIDNAISSALQVYCDELSHQGVDDARMEQTKLEESYYRLLNLAELCKQATERTDLETENENEIVDDKDVLPEE